MEGEFHYFLTHAWMAIAAVVFAALLFVPAPYGRHGRPGWGPEIGFAAGWATMEAPAVILMILFYIISDRRSDFVAVLLLCMWLFHYINRAFVYPFRMNKSARRMPLAVAAMGFTFNSINAYLQGRHVFTLSDDYSAEWIGTPQFIVGATLFFVGFAVNYQSDSILRSLRRPGEKGYRIPYGGLHHWVSCPNYLGEIIEWFGWAISTWSLSGLAFAIWTAANLIPRALANHKWSLAAFPDYPKDRKALIPFIL